jgi:cation diffusion facilitator family transporter
MTKKTPEMTHDKHAQQALAIKISIAGSIILFLISGIVGMIVDSITLLLDASASLVILFVAFLMHIALKKLHQPPDDLYNFGYSKYEPLTVAVQGGLIITTCVISIKFAIQDIIHVEDIHSYSLPTIAAFVSGIIGIFITFYLKNISRRTNSTMIKAASLHWYTDTVLSFGVCLGFFFGLMMQRLGYIQFSGYIDPVMAIILALIFIREPVKVVMHNALELLDAVPSEDIRSKVRKVVEQYKPKSLGVHRLRTRKAGERIFVEICFVLHDNLTIKEGEVLVNSFERDLNEHFPNSDVLVWFKPANPAKSPL